MSHKSRHAVVYDEADVGLVDAHAERVGGNDRSELDA
jgi:hypothetical protein